MSTATNTFGSFSCQRNFHTASGNFYQGTTEVTVVANSAWAHPYRSDLVVPKMQESIKANTSRSPQFLLGNAANFQRVEPNSYERPLLMDVWTQTTMEDFSLITDDRIQYSQKENEALREKVRLLEHELRVHSDLLNQIHATAALKTKAHESIEHISPTPPVTPVMSHNIKYNDAQQYQNVQRISPNATPAQANYTAAHAHTPQVMNSLQGNGGACIAASDSVKYTIVSNPHEKRENESVEPIEVHLAEEDGALNLNSSADSGRLEICLGDNEANHTPHEAANFKTEVIHEEQTLPPMSGILIKRRRENSQSQDGNTHAEYQTGTPVHYQTQSKRNMTMENSQGLSSNVTEQPIPNTLRHLRDENVMVSIGPNNTRVPYKLYESINWDSPSIATRKLLMAIFDRNTLATHSMTGKPSPAFKGQAKPQKQRLDPRVTEDIVFVVTRRCKVSDKEVRNAITTKCADENKMMKLQMNKKNSQRNNNNNMNKENQHYIAQQLMH